MSNTTLSSPTAWPPVLPTSSPPPQAPQKLSIPVHDEYRGSVQGYLHTPSRPSPPHPTAAILLSGAGGGTSGPSSIYLTLATRLSALTRGIPVLRLDYRYPARTRPCVADTIAAMDHLHRACGTRRFILVGWSFGGAPVFCTAAADRRVVGCVTVASQTQDALEGIEGVSPTPVLLLHGTGDRVLSAGCSKRLFEAYGKEGRRELRLFEGDDHALTRNSEEAERCIAGFVLERAGVDVEGVEKRGVLEKTLVGGREKVELMREGGDLRGGERVE